MALWMPLYETDARSAKSVIATFFQAFPEGVIWSNDSSGAGYDVVLFGQVPPTAKINLDRLSDWLERHPKVKASLEDVGFGWRWEPTPQEEIPETAVDLLATYAGQAPDLAPWTRGAQINEDRNLRLQYLAGLALNSNLSEEIFNDLLRHYRFPANLVEGSQARPGALRNALRTFSRPEPEEERVP